MEDRLIYDAVTDFIFMDEEPVRSDVIFIPGGVSCELPEKAAELWHSGLAPLIVPSGKYSVKTGKMRELKSGGDRYTGDYSTECDFYTDVLVQNGVPREAVIGEAESEFTYQNAVFTRRLLVSKGIKISSAIIVCKTFHARRSYMYYQREFPEARLYVVPAKKAFPDIQRENWFLSEHGRERVMGELERIGKQFV